MTPENAESVSENIGNGADSTSEPPSTEEISRIEASEWIENPAEVSVEEGFSGSKEIEGEKKDVTLGLLLLGVQDSFKGLVDGLPQVDWLRWWPWRHKRRLEQLVAEADANPNDAAKQSALLAELNKIRLSF